MGKSCTIDEERVAEVMAMLNVLLDALNNRPSFNSAGGTVDICDLYTRFVLIAIDKVDVLGERLELLGNKLVALGEDPEALVKGPEVSTS